MDATPLTLAMLKEIYHVLVEEFELTDLRLIYQKIFITIKNKYLFIIKKELNAFNIDQFSTPKKWGDTKKSIPTHVYGAKLYNAIIRDTFRPSDSFIMIKIKIDVYKLLEFLKGCSNNNEFAMSYEEASVLKAKINAISVPINMNDEDKALLGQRLKDLNIQLEFIWEELQTTEKNAFNKLLTAKTARESANIFSHLYERPKFYNRERENKAEEFYNA